jgi:hypothetical protein
MSDVFIPDKGPSMDDLIRPRARNKKKARPFKVNVNHLIAHFTAEVLRDSDEIKRGKIKWPASSREKVVNEILPTLFGKLCSVIPPTHRSEFLRILAESKGDQSFNECLEEWMNVRRAYEGAKAALNGVFMRDRPTFNEVWQQYSGDMSERALRRTLKFNSRIYPLHPDRRGAPHGRRKKKRATR